MDSQLFSNVQSSACSRSRFPWLAWLVMLAALFIVTGGGGGGGGGSGSDTGSGEVVISLTDAASDANAPPDFTVQTVAK